ncbi:MAG: 2-C-methyl-D-erythritol 4-phosphate cytidylyltransferase [Pseudonocardiales bacterium]|nr:2-C-methyl-D-erythritol 4-phosphate cytidylyltransferase [Pseudonocardiales bacterium]
MSVAAILLAAGAGERLGVGVPKALYNLAGKSLLEHAYLSLVADERIASVVVTAPLAEAEQIAVAMDGRAVVISGGRTRQDSVRLALAVLDPSVDVVLVHDAARPFVPIDVIGRVIDAVESGADGAVPALVVTDTIKRVGLDGAVLSTLNRTELRAVQTPQGFRVSELLSAHRYAIKAGMHDVSDDAGLIERHGGRIVLVEGSDESFKITRPWDLKMAELLVQSRS